MRTILTTLGRTFRVCIGRLLNHRISTRTLGVLFVLSFDLGVFVYWSHFSMLTRIAPIFLQVFLQASISPSRPRADGSLPSLSRIHVGKFMGEFILFRAPLPSMHSTL
ncbi:unnamed protein product, partial [Linum tenue]